MANAVKFSKSTNNNSNEHKDSSKSNDISSSNNDDNKDDNNISGVVEITNTDKDNGYMYNNNDFNDETGTNDNATHRMKVSKRSSKWV